VGFGEGGGDYEEEEKEGRGLGVGSCSLSVRVCGSRRPIDLPRQQGASLGGQAGSNV
jgi:hypothetical protein